ncbi:DNA-binding transcriptional regulator, AcrR family [Propionibacterium cyclohexanicum]|uniref:DNA-binding transcriptional regulator, AcrR family n=1 Tax=Propionibacterium cyclohexanicum TaxID=64702 RepID=A0A1H9QDQ2_9ACTN|nr:TetR/AcrR family transcriptional regulator [Propionibacterium cyclohexanicum]SER58305.1 DNA-binding transcriptional regulator, AcrR family [Propionibacterium cyclohexanicum]
MTARGAIGTRRSGTREAILAAATHLFATRGVSTTSVDEIAAAAGIAKGSIYYNFGSKSGLVEALMAEQTVRVAEAIRVATEGLAADALTRAVVRTLLHEVHDHPDAARVLVSEVFRTERSWRESVSTWRNAMMGPLTRDRGGAVTPIDRIAAAAVIGATLTAGLEWLVFHPELSFDQVCSEVISALGLDQG